MIKVTLKDASKLRLLIARKGESLRSFAGRIDVSQGYLSQILSGSYDPSAKIAYRIARGLDIPVDEIFLIEMIDISVTK